MHLRILDCSLIIHWNKTCHKTETQCLQRKLQCFAVKSDSCVLKQSLRSTLHRRSLSKDESSRISDDIELSVSFESIYHECDSLFAHFESLIEEQSDLLFLCRLSELTRKTLTLLSSSASQDTMNQASITSELWVWFNLLRQLPDCMIVFKTRNRHFFQSNDVFKSIELSKTSQDRKRIR